VRQVPLEVPLAALALGRPLERDDPGTAGVEVLGEALDRAALAGGVPALEDDDELLPRLLHPVLQLEQLDLQAALRGVVLGPRHALGVRVALAPGVDGRAVGAQEGRLALVVHDDAQARQLVGQR
jgi:hypothetical protein